MYQNQHSRPWWVCFIPLAIGFLILMCLVFVFNACTMKVHIEPEKPFVLEATDGTPFPLFHSKVNWCPITKDWLSAIVIHYNQVFGVITDESQLAKFNIPKIIVTKEMFESLINWLIVRKVKIISWQKVKPKLKLKKLSERDDYFRI